MKYLFIILLLLPVYASCETEEIDSPLSCGQPYKYLNLGVTIGTNKSNLSHSFDNLLSNSTFGINLGIQYNHPIGYASYPNEGILLRASYISNSIEYDFKNTDANINNIKFSENDKILQLTSCYQFAFLSSGKIDLHVLIGPYFNYILDNKNFSNNIIINNESFKKYELGATVGIGFDLWLEDFIVGIEYNYQYAFTDKYKYNNDYIRNNSHFINFIFSPNIYIIKKYI